MRIGQSHPLQFQPRYTSYEEQVEDHEGTDASYEAPDSLSELRAENPWLSRSLDCAHVGLEAVEQWTGSTGSPFLRGVSTTIAVGGAVWGVDKVVRGQTFLDRVEAIGSLALSAEMTASAANVGGQFGNVMGAIHGCADLTTGGSDSLRGLREKDRRRLGAGLLQMAAGTSAVVSAVVPGASAVTSTVALGAVLARQAVLSR